MSGVAGQSPKVPKAPLGAWAAPARSHSEAAGCTGLSATVFVRHSVTHFAMDFARPTRLIENPANISTPKNASVTRETPAFARNTNQRSHPRPSRAGCVLVRYFQNKWTGPLSE